MGALVIEVDNLEMPQHLTGPDGHQLTPTGNTDRFLARFDRDIRWVMGNSQRAAGTYFVWHGNRWAEDDRAQVRAWAAGTMRDLGRQLIGPATQQGMSPEQVKALLNFWRISDSPSGIDDVLRETGHRVAVVRSEFDADPLLLGLPNGVLDLRDGSFRSAQRTDMITKLAGAEYDADATCPTWNRFLLETCNGDESLVRYLQICAGVCLSGLVEEHLFFLVIGPAGTGKSTFGEVLMALMGDYALGVDPNTLAATKAEVGRARPDLAKLHRVRLAFANESRAGLRLDEGLVKSMTGGDTLTARFLYEQEFDFRPTHKIWLRTNHEPQLDGSDTGIRRRMKVVPFTHLVENRDTRMPAKLNAELSGILNWALTGWMEYREGAWSDPAVVIESTREYLDGQDTVGTFLEECCERNSQVSVPAKEIYSAYRAWITERGQHPVSIQRFAADLRGRGYLKLKGMKGAAWVGIRVLNQYAHGEGVAGLNRKADSLHG